MTKIIDRLNCINRIGTFQCENVIHSRASARCQFSLIIIQHLAVIASRK